MGLYLYTNKNLEKIELVGFNGNRFNTLGQEALDHKKMLEVKLRRIIYCFFMMD
jgi:hypothetical protein